MICPECKNPVSPKKTFCETCGYDLTLYRKAIRLSMQYYNRGLASAKVRNLSGAIVLLKRSLELYKRNTDARNLLGLVYFETGETVAAISEWVISKHFQGKDNAADYYMEIIQNNPVKLDAVNQAIRKYNIAVEAAHQGTDDLAVLQLKKVIGIQPSFIRAMQLLSLLYMKNNELERARKLLQRILRIDVANIVALRYLKEVETALYGGAVLNETATDTATEAFQAAAPVTYQEEEYQEEKPNVMAFVGLIAGILIGIAVVFYMIVPAREDKIRQEYLAEEVDYSETLNSKLAQINSLQTKIASLEIENEELQRDLSEAVTKVEYVAYENPEHMQLFTDLFEAVCRYADYMVDRQLKEDKGTAADESLCLAAADALLTVDISKTENEEAVKYYTKMCDSILPDAASYTYKQGKTLYDEKSYTDAIPYLEASISYDPDYDRPIYYAGRAYQAIDNTEKALYYYDMLLNLCPDSSLSGYASDRIKALKGTE